MKQLVIKNGIAYGYRHNVQQRVRTGTAGRKPPMNPRVLMPCPYCEVTVIADAHRYWDEAAVLHAHQPARYGVSEDEANGVRRLHRAKGEVDADS